ncbi:uncharacterized protein LOC107406769 [Ziziphus jujuba]|uniref:Uncharacterized protein LOC107406769 n=1 Tax=Ziziphus jujuba TaxID=326968 RepID=A0A6P3YZ54_ZIZJJ|nr:uncharacterized protein LOC107406769 [Ziziphus jujuba]
MERLELDYRLILFITLLSNHATISSSSTITQPMSNPLQEIVCAAINCGQGTCKASNASLLGFDCECYPGWKKIQIGPLTFPSCLLPNCTVDFQCGKGSPPPSPPPPPVSLPPPLNLSNPCGLVWCGEGICVTNGTGYTCQCFEGSENLMNLATLPCFKQCSLGADCNALMLGSPPQPNSSTSKTTGLTTDLRNCLSSIYAVTVMLLAAIFF